MGNPNLLILALAIEKQASFQKTASKKVIKALVNPKETNDWITQLTNAIDVRVLLQKLKNLTTGPYGSAAGLIAGGLGGVGIGALASDKLKNLGHETEINQI